MQKLHQHAKRNAHKVSSDTVHILTGAVRSFVMSMSVATWSAYQLTQVVFTSVPQCEQMIRWCIRTHIRLLFEVFRVYESNAFRGICDILQDYTRSSDGGKTRMQNDTVAVLQKWMNEEVEAVLKEEGYEEQEDVGCADSSVGLVSE